MAAAKAKSASTSGAGKKTSDSVPSTPVDAAEAAAYGSGKPDKALYDAEQAKIKTEIDALQVKVVRCVSVQYCVLDVSIC